MLQSLKMMLGALIIYGIVSSVLTVVVDEGTNGEHSGFFKCSVLILVIATAVNVILPSRETAYKMLMASYVTPNNIHTVGKEANKAVGALLDNITNHMKELKDAK